MIYIACFHVSHLFVASLIKICIIVYMFLSRLSFLLTLKHATTADAGKHYSISCIYIHKECDMFMV